MTDPEKSTIDSSSRESLISFLMAMDANQLGVLSFNLGGIAWIGLNLTLGRNMLPCYLPGAYLYTGSLSLLFLPVLIFALVLGCVAIRRGRLLPAALTLTFGWALVASFIREFSP